MNNNFCDVAKMYSNDSQGSVMVAKVNCDDNQSTVMATVNSSDINYNIVYICYIILCMRCNCNLYSLL